MNIALKDLSNITKTDNRIGALVACMEFIDTVIRDENASVRKMVAERGYFLDKLVKDRAWVVRQAVVKQGYGLEELINDPSPYVRAAVAAKMKVYGINPV